jgi:hypothetical protein
MTATFHPLPDKRGIRNTEQQALGSTEEFHPLPDKRGIRNLQCVEKDISHPVSSAS